MPESKSLKNLLLLISSRGAFLINFILQEEWDWLPFILQRNRLVSGCANGKQKGLMVQVPSGLLSIYHLLVKKNSLLREPRKKST